MSVTNYLAKSERGCKYSYNKLKPYIYLVGESHLKDVTIDSMEAYISGLTESPLRIDGFNIQLSEETSLDERYLFQKTLTLSMHGYATYKLFDEKYYAIIESEDGTLFMINVDFPSRITHTFNLSKDVNQTDFTFACFSNFPTLKLNAEFDSVEVVCRGYKVNGIDSLKLLEKQFTTLDPTNKKVISTEEFNDVEYLGDSCVFQEVYDGFNVTDTITFNIAFDDYKPSWQWSLLEFLDNRYSAIIAEKGSNFKYYSGFNFGLQPSYTISSNSQNGQSDIITVTLVEASSNGSTAADDWDEMEEEETKWQYVKYVGDIVCWICASPGLGMYLIMQEVDLLGNPTGRYKVLEGFESRYEDLLNIVGTFDEIEVFIEPKCIRPRPEPEYKCRVLTDIPSSIEFTSTTCNTYSLETSCNWEITDIPSGITISPTSGEANSSYTVSICNTLTPTSSPVENYFKIGCCESEILKKITVKQADNTCLKPSSKSINYLAQNVVFTFNSNCQIEITSIDPRLTYQFSYNTLTVQVPENTTSSAITWNITYKNCECNPNAETVSIIQGTSSFKFRATYSGGSTYELACNESSTLASGETRPDGYVFSSMTDAVIGDCVTNIGGWALFQNGINVYRNCSGTSLSSVTIPNSVTSIGERAFANCCKLTGVTIPNSVTSIGSVAFSYCSSMDNITLPTGLTSISDWLLNDTYSLHKVNLPSGVTSIGKFAFAESGIEYINIPTGVTSIGKNAFAWCYYLNNIIIPSGVTTLEECVFLACHKFTNITIPDSVTSIGEWAFEMCSGLTSIDIPNSVTTIARGAFHDCTSLTSCTIGNGVTTIGSNAFSSCGSLTSVVIPDNVTSIGGSAFYYCDGLTSCTIGSGVTSIGDGAFYGCSGLTSITVNATTPPTLGNAVFNSTNNCPIYVPCDSVNAYKSANEWNYYASRIQAIPGSCTEPTFNGKFKATYSGGTTYSAECDSSTSLTTATTKPSGYEYSAMTTGIIGNCVTSIGGSAFEKCSGLTSIEIPDSVTSIGNFAFYGCSGLTNINIPSGVTSIGEATFYKCYSLTSITIPNSVTSIDYAAFHSCSGLTSIDIPSGVTSIGDYSFAWCSSLTSFTIGSGVTSIGDSAFYYCSGLTSIDIPSGVTSIGHEAFSCCSGLTSIDIPSGVTSIGEYAFDRCSSLTSITVNATTPPVLLGNGVFINTNNCPIYVPSGSVTAYKNASGWSTYSSRIFAIS